MNTKARSCSTESCGFFGAYGELRKHARTDHPLVRPSEADPERERDWRRLEQQRDLGDLFSTMQSALGGEEDGFTFLADGGEFGGLFPLPTITFFLVLRFRGARGLSTSAGWPNRRRGASRSSRPWRRRGRVLWGESIVEAEAGGRDRSDADDGDDIDNDYDQYDDEDDDSDGNDDDGGGEDVSDASRQHQRRTRRQLRMVDDDANGTNGTDIIR